MTTTQTKMTRGASWWEEEEALRFVVTFHKGNKTITQKFPTLSQAKTFATRVQILTGIIVGIEQIGNN
jgi:hypothetical protein